MTNYGEELEQHRRWKPKPEYAQLRVFDELLENEFRSAAHQDVWQDTALRQMLRFSVNHTSYYAELFSKRGLTLQEVGSVPDLVKLPILRKQDVIECQKALTARALPPGERIFGAAKSSGTTGAPVTVLQTEGANTMFGLLRHRTSRWFKLDPMASRVDIRPRGNMVQQASDNDPVLRRPHWHYLGRYFQTGPEFSFNTTNPMDKQVQWLRELRPHYAMTLPGVFAEWLFACEGRVPVDSLRALVGIGAQMTASLRTYIERNYNIPVHQAYGLNEIGAVATRCDAGRYHVNVEHCLVEIANDDGAPVPPGETGHLLVTALRNCAMPLIRYDTGDLAEAVAGPCPCGRTLPSFGEIAGRHRNYAGLPPFSRERVRALRSAIEQFPPDEMRFLRRYQIHQDRENAFTLRLQTVSPVPEAFRVFVFAAWNAVEAPSVPLAIVELDEILAPRHGKLLDFVSEFHIDFATPSQPRAMAPEEFPR